MRAFKKGFLVAGCLAILVGGEVAAVKDIQMLSLGDKAPAFELPDVVTGESVSLETFSDNKALLVMSVCRSCPYVKHVIRQVAQLGRDYADKEIGIVAISANDPNRFPADAPEGLKAMAQEFGFTFPLVYDESQAVAKAYTAAFTPDFFLFNESRTLVYRGQFDDSRPGNGIPVTGEDLRGAIEAVLAGGAVDTNQKPSFGCSIKWKPGNAPSYAQ